MTVWKTVPQLTVAHHQAQGQVHPAAHKTVEVFTVTLPSTMMTYWLPAYISFYVYLLLHTSQYMYINIYAVYKLFNHGYVFIY